MEKIGIDAGGSLTKVAYHEQGKWHVKTYPNDKMRELIQWLQMISPNAHLYLTGGKSEYLKNTVKQNGTIVEEFKALTEGTRFLLHKENTEVNDEFILVSVGTGTSIFHVTQQGFDRLLGSGIGGGTFMGLGKLISGKSNFQELVELANTGDHEKSDLLVRDIYAPNEPPILGSLTAANFGKAHFNMEAEIQDHMAALVQLIGETLLQLAYQAASMKQVEKIVFVGSTLTGNASLKEILRGFQKMMRYEAVFLSKGAHAGAIGTLI
ncbi:MAG TPA: type II pantothenate kinase [Candidatus Avamphibacillus sp.]|nr:type II pantothenate kinase [Candidatus Avamphibacillus sp.]